MTDIDRLTSGLQHRDIPVTLEVREDSDGKREVSGIGVPYNSPTEIYGVREQFAPGAVQPSEGTKLFWRHDAPIGKVVESSNSEDGWHHRSVISKTPQGDEAYTLARDGVVDRFSVGFEPVEHLEEKADDGTITITHTKVRVREVSLVPFPAYDDAKLTNVRAADTTHATTEGNTMGNENREQDGAVATVESVDELRGAVDELTRRVEVGLTRDESDTGHTTGARSFGDFVQRIASGDEQATRAYTGAVSGDFVLEDQWIGSLVQIIHKRQTAAGTFARGPLPAKGLTVEYAELDSDTTDVDEQSSEGSDLSFGKVSVTTKTASVKTLGGYSTLSRQAIERTENVNVLDVTFSAMAEKYGQAVEAQARAALKAYLQGSSVNSVTGDLSSADNIIAALVDLASEFDTNGLSFDGLFLDAASFKALAKVAESAKVLQMTGAPTDKAGTVSVNTLSASLSNIPVRVLPNVSYTPSGGSASTTLILAYDTSAIRTLESAGAPVQLQDDNIINLSRDFSVYGYCASFVQRPKGLVVLEAA